MKRLPGAIFIVDPHRERIARDRGEQARDPGRRRPATRTSTRTSSTTSSRPTTTRSGRSGCCARSSPTRRSRAPRERSARAPAEPEPSRPMAMPEPEDDESRARRRARRRPRRRRGALVRARRRRRRPAARRPRRPRPRPPSPSRPAEASPEEIAAELAREAAEKDDDDGRRLTPALGTADAAGRRRRPDRPRPPARRRPGRRDEQENEQAWRTSRRSSVKELRERTGAGFMDCKRALDRDRRRPRQGGRAPARAGLAAAAKKAGRDAREGLVSSYIHTGGRVGVLIEVNCETDFVARTDEFQKLVRDLAVQVAGPRPAVRRRRRDPGRRRSRRSRPSCSPTRRPRRSPRTSGRRSSRASSRSGTRRSACYDQPFRDEERTVRDLITEQIATIGENIRVRRFTRYALGEEL